MTKGLKNIEMAGPWFSQLEKKYVNEALEHGWYGKNAYKFCHLFEDAFAKFCKRKFALMTTNCTSAIHLGLAAKKISEKDEVIVPECTWIGSCAGVIYQRSKIVFADIEQSNWCLSAKTIEPKITEKTKAIIVVNLYGNMAEWDQIKKLADKYNLIIFEDAAESIGSTYKNIPSGKFGDASFFSFHRTKTLCTGEGGMLVTDDKKLFERAKFLRDHGRQPGSYFTEEVAYKYMPFNLQAALGYGQLQRVNELVEKKRKILFFYKKYLKDLDDIQLNYENNYIKNSAWCSTLVLGKSYKITFDEIKKKLEKKNLPVRNFFFPLSSLPAFKLKSKYKLLNPNAYSISKKGINLPSALNLEEEDIKYYCKNLIDILY